MKPPKRLVSPRTVKRIAESPEEFARLLLGEIGTDATEDFLDRLWAIWSAEGCHK
jgi:hypothetical protein